MRAPTGLVFALICGFFGVNEARADAPPPQPSPPPKERVGYDATLGIRLNPLGLEAQYNLSYRRRLYASTSPAFRDNYVGVVLAPTYTPAVVRTGGVLEVRPATVLALSAGLFRIGYLSSFGSLQSYPDATAAFSDDEQKAGRDAGKNYPLGGTQFTLRATALAKVGPIVIRDDALLYHDDLEVPAGDRVYYNPRLDLLGPAQGYSLINDTDLVWLSDFGFIGGVRGTVTHAFLSADEEGTADGRTTPLVRVGPLAAYTFFDEPGARFNKPTVIGIAGFWINHPYRAGQDVSRAVPTVFVAFRCEGELWKSRD